METFGGTLLHAANYTNGAAFRGQRALLVGFGNTGAELAVDLVEHGADVTVLARSPVHIIPRWLANLPLLGARPFEVARTSPLWLSDALYANLVKPLLYSDLPSLGLQLRQSGIKSDIHLRHSAPVMDIGTISLIREGRIRVVSDEIERFVADGVVFRRPSSAGASKRQSRTERP